MSWSLLLSAMLPENLLLAGIVVLLALAITGRESNGALAVSLLSTGAATLAALAGFVAGGGASPFPAHLGLDAGAMAAKAVMLALTLPILMFSRDDFRDGRFHVLLLTSLYGACLLVSSESFLTLFLAIELMSIPVYVLVVLGFKRPESAEAALKYLVLSGTASATLLMGASLLYGTGGSLALSAFAQALGNDSGIGRMGVVLVIVAFFLKAAVVPFHTWAPDAYEAASVPVTAYMATIVKAGVLLAAVRLFGSADAARPIADLIAILPLVSIVWGNLTAMRQASFRRMIAYSSIAHAGYLFYAFLGDAPGRFQAVLFYVLAYGLMNVLAFAALPADADDHARDRLEGLKGLFHRQPFAALMIGGAMLSLAGLPPFPGFVAKFLIFRNVMAAGYTAYAVLGLVGSYLGLYFYLRVVQYLFMTPGAETANAVVVRRAAWGASVLCLVPVLLLIVFPGAVISRF
jgi:NADH-quinone oxidoreductase subunit N